MSSKYKAGDELVWAGSANSEFYTVGKAYKILSNPSSDYYGADYILEDNGRSMHHWDAEGIDENFVRSSASPIRTVTRREIVPGTYAEVDIDNVYADFAACSYCGDGSAASLREAARIFIEIADVLDEQKAVA